MGAVKDIWESERGLLALAIIIAATVLVALGKMPVSDWQTFVTGVFIAYAAGKTATGVAAIIKGPRPAADPPSPAPVPVPPADVEVKL